MPTPCSEFYLLHAAKFEFPFKISWFFFNQNSLWDLKSIEVVIDVILAFFLWKISIKNKDENDKNISIK